MQIANKNEIPQELTVKIEKLSNLGLGIAHYNGYVLFVENTCPEDVVKIRLKKKNKSFGTAEVVDLTEPSPYRCESICPLQKVCGACQLGFIDYDYQLKLKKEVVEDTMRSIYGYEIEVKDVIPSPETKGYRRKIQYPVSQTKESKRIIAGYYKPSSHELVNIKYCPVQPEICDKIIDFIRTSAQELNISGYTEKSHKGILRHVIIRNSEYNNKNLVVLVINSDFIPESVKKLAENIYNSFEEVTSVGINLNNKKTNLILGEKTEILFGSGFVEEKLCDKVFKIGAGTFFQINTGTAENIFNYIKNYIFENYEKPVILDAYAGISAFGICLSDIAKKVVSVEVSKSSIDMAKDIIEENHIENIELFNMDTAEYCKKCEEKFDITVIDPPRKGCTTESLENVFKLTKKQIIYVSCNPATLARDLKYLKGKGCKINSVQPFDMFPHTYHIENVAIIDLPE